MNRFCQLLVAVSVAVGLALVPVASVHAQSSSGSGTVKHNTNNPLPADVKGTLGVGLIGAELGFVLPAVAGLHDTWAFIVFPIVGAAGGAAAGYFGIEKGNHTKLAVASLTAGMALLIPALVITISETAYDPGDEARVDPRDPRYAGGGMVRVSEGGLALAAPGVDVMPTTARSGRTSVSGAQVSLLSGRF